MCGSRASKILGWALTAIGISLAGLPLWAELFTKEKSEATRPKVIRTESHESEPAVATTAIYTHLTSTTQAQSLNVIDDLVAGLWE